MTEFKSKIQHLEPFKEEIKMLPKRWIASLSRPTRASPRHRNSVVEITYHQIVKLAKSLYSTLNLEDDRRFFEKDDRYDNSENCFAMHTFLNNSFHLHLECSYDYNYRIEYDFYNSPFEKQLMEQLQIGEHYIPDSCKHRQLKPNCKEFFNRVIQVQDAKYTTVLPHIVNIS